MNLHNRTVKFNWQGWRWRWASVMPSIRKITSWLLLAWRISKTPFVNNQVSTFALWSLKGYFTSLRWCASTFDCSESVHWSFKLVSTWLHLSGIRRFCYPNDWQTIAQTFSCLIFYLDQLLQLYLNLGNVTDREKLNLDPSHGHGWSTSKCWSGLRRNSI